MPLQQFFYANSLRRLAAVKGSKTVMSARGIIDAVLGLFSQACYTYSSRRMTFSCDFQSASAHELSKQST